MMVAAERDKPVETDTNPIAGKGFEAVDNFVDSVDK